MNPHDPDRLSVAPDGRPEEDQPRWRRDFPIDWPADRSITHRDFIRFLLLVSAGFVTGQVGLVLRSLRERAGGRGAPLDIAGADEIPVGGSLVFHYPDANHPCLLVRLEENRYLAYEQTCTHLACPVIPRVAEGRFDCPCHDGRFDLATGRPLAGPPRRPLARIDLEIRDGRIRATGVKGGAA